jgi:hypothetical protein
MKAILVAIYDKKAEFYDRPVLTQNIGTAVRMIENTLKDETQKSLQMCKTPEDFSLWKLGEYDELSGEIEPDRVLIGHVDTMIQDPPTVTDMELFKDAANK